MAGWKPKVCACGHLEADHLSSGAPGPLRRSAGGKCKCCSCACFVNTPCDQSDEQDREDGVS